MASPSAEVTSAAPASRRLVPGDLLSLEQYARERPAFRARVIAHKQPRTVGVGPHTTWCFEDRLTIQYQVQEMLRAERIFEARGIQDELDAYHPLIPDGTNLKATFLIEYTDPDERAVALMRLKGIESCCFIAIGDAVASAIADEDLERENDTKTSAVHFLRFELGAGARAFLAAGAPLRLGINHPAYSHSLEVSAETRAALIADLAP
jgi:hypothetical protein